MKGINNLFQFQYIKRGCGDNYLLKGHMTLLDLTFILSSLKIVKIAQLIFCTSNLSLLGNYHKEIIVIREDVMEDICNSVNDKKKKKLN